MVDPALKRIDAEQFVLRDRKGRPRAGLTALQSGTAALALLDTEGYVRAALFVNEAGTPSVCLYAKGE